MGLLARSRGTLRRDVAFRMYNMATTRIGDCVTGGRRYSQVTSHSKLISSRFAGPTLNEAPSGRLLTTSADDFDNSNDGFCLPFSVNSLGLETRVILPRFSSIRQLPEVDSALQQFPSLSAMESLKRAVNVFESFQKGGPEHLAACALLAECQQRLALYDNAVSTLDNLADLSRTEPTTSLVKDDIMLAQAKTLWTKGEFKAAEERCESIICHYNDLDETFPTTNLHMASAMTGKALSQLAAMQNIDDAYSVRDFFRIAIKFLERHPPSDSNPLPVSAVYSNCGVAEAVYAIFLEEVNNVSVPMDAALRTWFRGLQKIENRDFQEFGKQVIAASATLQASMQANLAWGILNYEQDREDRLSKASDYARQALAVYDSNSADASSEGFRRMLSIVASCYHQADSAVTAEGLFQSAIDEKTHTAIGTLSLLELRNAYDGYADLCGSWEKREGEAVRLRDRVEEVDALLPGAWKGKSGIYSCLWFWTPSDFESAQ